ncbi:hypothetical protein KR074_002091, partial [Drosophila pseudoananassae]
NKVAKELTSTYRLCALRVCSGFRMISDDSALVIAGMVPIDLLATERQELYQALVSLNGQASAATRRQIKVSSRATSIQKWQRLWDKSTKRRWTHQLVPDLEIWLQRRHSEINFWLTQIIRSFRSYLYKFGPKVPRMRGRGNGGACGPGLPTLFSPQVETSRENRDGGPHGK